MNVTDRASHQNAFKYCISGHPHTMIRKHVNGGSMLDIRGCKFEQLIRDKVKAKQISPFQEPVSISIRYNAKDQYIVDVAKSVLDGLNHCAYEDDCQVHHLVVENTHEIDLVDILIKDSKRQLYTRIPAKAIGKQEPHSKQYAECGAIDTVLQARLQKTAEIMLGLKPNTIILSTVAIKMAIFVVGGRGDIDNISKFYLEAMSVAGIINKTNVLSIEVGLYEDTNERIEIELLSITAPTEKPTDIIEIYKNNYKKMAMLLRAVRGSGEGRDGI